MTNSSLVTSFLSAVEKYTLSWGVRMQIFLYSLTINVVTGNQTHRWLTRAASSSHSLCILVFLLKPNCWFHILLESSWRKLCFWDSWGLEQDDRIGSSPSPKWLQSEVLWQNKSAPSIVAGLRLRLENRRKTLNLSLILFMPSFRLFFFQIFPFHLN